MPFSSSPLPALSQWEREREKRSMAALLFCAKPRETSTLAIDGRSYFGVFVFDNWGFTQSRKERKDIRRKGRSVLLEIELGLMGTRFTWD